MRLGWMRASRAHRLKSQNLHKSICVWCAQCLDRLCRCGFYIGKRLPPKLLSALAKWIKRAHKRFCMEMTSCLPRRLCYKIKRRGDINILRCKVKRRQLSCSGAQESQSRDVGCLLVQCSRAIVDLPDWQAVSKHIFNENAIMQIMWSMHH